MRASYPYLSQKLTERGISLEYLAQQLELDETTLSMKLDGLLQWDLAEAVRICCLLHTPNLEKLFYS